MKITIPKQVFEVSFSQFVGKRICERRKELGMTAESLADNAGLSKSFLSDVENGKRSMSFGNMAKIAKQLGRSLDWFVKGWED
jgi:transcriptional regulator with XRE-family HTH domain